MELTKAQKEYKHSKNYRFMAYDDNNKGKAFEVIKANCSWSDWFLADNTNSIDLSTGNRFSRFLCTGQWTGEQVRDYLRNLGLKPIL